MLELHITAPNNNTVFNRSSTIIFTGTVTTNSVSTTTTGIYFKWFSTQAPWATVDTDAHINTTLQGSTALSFSTNMNYVTSPESGGWGIGTQWIQFTCMDTSGMTTGDLQSVNTNGIDGGQSTITLSDWTINPRKIHILEATLIHPEPRDRYDYVTTGNWTCRTSGATNNNFVPLYFKMRPESIWFTSDSRIETAVTDWNTDTDDELVAELHVGSIGTAGDAFWKSDVNASTFVADLTNSLYFEYEIGCLWTNWQTSSTGTYTLYLIVYHKDNRITTVNDSVTIDVVA